MLATSGPYGRSRGRFHIVATGKRSPETANNNNCFGRRSAGRPSMSDQHELHGWHWVTLTARTHAPEVTWSNIKSALLSGLPVQWRGIATVSGLSVCPSVAKMYRDHVNHLFIKPKDRRKISFRIQNSLKFKKQTKRC